MGASGHGEAHAFRGVHDRAVALQAKNTGHDPVGVLRKKVRKDRGRQPSVGEGLRLAMLAQYAAHKSWSVQLHYDNLRVLVEQDPALGPLPSYSTVRRYMKATGLAKRRRLSSKDTAGVRRAERRLEEREVRSYEAAYVNGLWHLDFHHGSRKVLTASGEWATALLFGVLDDRSRLCGHVQLVSRRGAGRGPGARALAGDPEARAAAGADDRQRAGGDRRRGAPGTLASGDRPRDDAGA
jgi:hypothetical protein